MAANTDYGFGPIGDLIIDMALTLADVVDPELRASAVAERQWEENRWRLKNEVLESGESEEELPHATYPDW